MSKAKKAKEPEIPGVRTLRLRIKDRHRAELEAKAREVNFVWNYCNDLAVKVFERERRFLTGYDFAKYTAGATKDGLMTLHSQTVQAIAEQYARSREQARKVRLAWRKSGGVRRSLGWVPFKASAQRYRNGQMVLSGFKRPVSLWDSYGLADYDLGPGSLSEDSRGRWYLNIVATPKRTAPVQAPLFAEEIGVDLNLKTTLGTSSGIIVDAKACYRKSEARLGLAQRAGKKCRIKSIHARIKNQRSDFLHQLSTKLVNTHGAIFVGNVNASGLAKTRMAKSVLDAGWSTFRTQLLYKGADAGIVCKVVNEAFSTVTCSVCLARLGPKGVAGLRIREWTCPDCKTAHHRDVNAGQNILRLGRQTLAVGIPALPAKAAAVG